MGRGKKFKGKTREETSPGGHPKETTTKDRRESSDESSGGGDTPLIDPGGVLIQSVWESFRCYDADKQKRIVHTCYAAYISNRKAMPHLTTKMLRLTNTIVLSPLLFGTAQVDPFIANALQSRGIIKQTQRGPPANFTKDVFALCRFTMIIVDRLECMIVDDMSIFESIVDVLMERAFEEGGVLFGNIDFIDERVSRRNADDDNNNNSNRDDRRDSLDNQLKWIDKLAEWVYARARMEPWYQKTEILTNWQMKALIFVLGKSFAFLVLLSVKWINEADLELYETMMVRDITHRQSVLFKNRGNVYYEQCKNDPNVGTAFRKKMRWFIPITIYSMGIDSAMHSAVLYNNRSKCYLNQNLYEEALADALRAVVLEPTWAKAYFRMAEALYELGRYSDAVCVNDRARIRCLADTTMNKDKDMESLADQSKNWKKKEDTYPWGKSGWTCQPKESVKQKDVREVENKLNYAVDMFNELLADKEYLSLEEARRAWEKDPALQERMTQKPFREACSFPEAHEFITMDAKSRIALFMTTKKEVYISVPERMTAVRAKFGSITWANSIPDYELRFTRLEQNEADEKLARNYKKDEKFLLETNIADKNCEILSLNNKLQNSDVQRRNAEKQTNMVMALMKVMESNLESRGMPDLTSKKQLGDNMESARKAGMVPLVEKLNEAYDTIFKHEKEVKELKKILAESEANHCGTAEGNNAKSLKNCKQCAALAEENTKLKEKDLLVDKMFDVMGKEANKARKQAEKFDAMEEKIELLTKELATSQEAALKMQKEAEKSRDELMEKQEEIKALKEASMLREERNGELSKENLILRDKIVNGVVDNMEIEKVSKENSDLKNELTNIQKQYRKALKEIEKWAEENSSMRNERKKDQRQNEKNVRELEKFCDNFNRSSQTVLTSYEDDIFSFSSWIEGVMRVLNQSTTEEFRMLASQKDLGFQKIKFMQQIRLDNESNISELKRNANAREMKIAMKECAIPPAENLDFTTIFQSLAILIEKSEDENQPTYQRETSNAQRNKIKAPLDTQILHDAHGLADPQGHPNAQGQLDTQISNNAPLDDGLAATESERVVKKFPDVMSEMGRMYPHVPLPVLLMVFHQFREENGKLTGMRYVEIVNALEIKLDYLLQHLTRDELKYIASGAAPKRRGDQRVDECPICLDPLENADDYICDNGHKFHRHCISSWCSKAEAPSCPTCRNTITLDVAMPAPPQLIITQ